MKKITRSTKIILINVLIGLSLFIFNLFFIFSEILGIISIVIVIGCPAVFEYMKYKEKKDIEEKFPDFLRDVSANIKTGMTIPQAVTATKETYYGALTPHIKRMIVQIDWGIPFDKILNDFAKRSPKTIKRSVSTIIDTHKGGGDIADVFDAVGRSTVEINRIRKERSSIIYNQMITGYTIFFLFVGILVILQSYLLPSLYIFTSPEMDIASSETLGKFYLDTFKLLILLQGFFAGLVIGKMSEGSIIAGLKHSFILAIIGYSVLWFFA